MHLLCAKSRVIPLKGATILRLKFNGMLCLSSLVIKVAQSWNIDSRSCRLWDGGKDLIG